MEEVPWWRRLLFEQRKFVSPLSRTEVVRRLGAAIDPMFSPFGGFPVYSHDYDRLEAEPRMERVRAIAEEMLRFSRAPPAPASSELSP